MADQNERTRASHRLRDLKKKVRRYIQWNQIGCPVYRDQLLGTLTRLTQFIDDPNLNAALADTDPAEAENITRFTDAKDKATILRDWIFNNFPKHADGAWRVYSYDIAGNKQRIQLTAGQLSTVVSQITALRGTVDPVDNTPPPSTPDDTQEPPQ